MTETKTFRCTRCGKEYAYTPGSSIELFEEPLICAKCYDEIWDEKLKCTTENL